jgi:hypothetical protein
MRKSPRQLNLWAIRQSALAARMRSAARALQRPSGAPAQPPLASDLSGGPHTAGPVNPPARRKLSANND